MGVSGIDVGVTVLVGVGKISDVILIVAVGVITGVCDLGFRVVVGGCAFVTVVCVFIVASFD